MDRVLNSYFNRPQIKPHGQWFDSYLEIVLSVTGSCVDVKLSKLVPVSNDVVLCHLCAVESQP